MTFPLESNLIEAFAPSIPNFLQKESFRAHRYEVGMGTRIADIVGVAIDASLHSDTELLEQLRRSRCVDLVSAANLLARPLTLEALARRNLTRPEWLEDRILRLERIGLLGRTRTGNAFAWADLELPDEVVAFEAKLTDWREAVRQAAHYTDYADRSWVVMPIDQNRNDELRSACSRFGVGLVLVHPDGSIVKPVRPRSSEGDLEHRRRTKLRLLWELVNNPDKFTSGERYERRSATP